MEQGDRGPWRTVIAGALLLLVVLGAYLLCSGSGELAPPSPMPQVASVSARDASSSVAIGGIVEDRDSVVVASSDDGEAVLFSSYSQVVLRCKDYPAWQATVRVVDDLGAPVADAIVRWMPFLMERPGVTMTLDTKASEASTDRDGYVLCAVKGPMASVSAEKAGCVPVVPATLFQEHHQATELVLVLPRSILLRGIVRQADGTPVPKAAVTVARFPTAYSPVQERRAPEGVKCVTGDDGRFEVQVQIGLSYHCHAVVNREGTWPVDVVIARDAPEVELLVRGGISVNVAVLGLDGEPVVDATVYAWRETDVVETLQGERLRADTVRGTYKLLLPEFGTYQVAAVTRDCVSGDPVAVTVDATHAHANATLRLQERATIRGRVVGVDGKPQAGALVSAKPAGMPRGARQNSSSSLARLGVVKEVRSVEDGTFAVSVHPGLDWDITAVQAGDRSPQSSPAKRCTKRGVMAGSAAVELVLGGSEVVLSGVVTRYDGEAVGGCSIAVMHREGAVSASLGGGTGHPDEQGRFTLPAIEIDGDVFVVLRPHDPELAPQEQGPILVGTEPLELRFCLAPWGQLPVQVVDAQGSGVPAAQVRVNIAGLMPGLGSGGTGATDSYGRVTLPRCMPGDVTVSVSRIGGKVFEQQVQVVPGANAVLFVRLP